jgi:hypothetical protein
MIERLSLVRVYGVGAGRRASKHAGMFCILAMSIVLLCDVPLLVYPSCETCLVTCKVLIFLNTGFDQLYHGHTCSRRYRCR